MPVAQGPWDMNRRASGRATETGRMCVPVGAATSLWSVYLQYLAWMVAAAAAEGEEGREKVKKGMGESGRRNEYEKESKLRAQSVWD